VVMKLQAHRFEHQGAIPGLCDPLPRQLPGARDRAVSAQPAHPLSACPAGSPSSKRPRSRTSLPTCACWPTTTMTRLSSAPSARPGEASAPARCRRWAAMPANAGFRSSLPPSSRASQRASDTPTHPAARVLRVHQTPASARRQRTGSTGDGRSAHRHRLRAWLYDQDEARTRGSSGATFRSSATG
jgi:hypothetical protein